jgi:hypothetical protein
LKLGIFAFYLSTKLARLDLLKLATDTFLNFDIVDLPNACSIDSSNLFYHYRQTVT